MRNLLFENEETNASSSSVCESDRYLDSNFKESACETINLRELIKERIERNEVFCSFELFPTERRDDTYHRFFADTKKFSPLFYALTWHGGQKEATECLSLKLIEKFPNNTLLHLAASGLKRVDIEKILNKVLACGITNIFTLRGDSPLCNGDFPHAIDLVAFIREKFGTKFCICVAGYPEMHPESPSKELDLLHLKAKVDAGADFIITQIVFDSNVFIRFVNDCRNVGIRAPIIPGIFPIPQYKCLERMASVCKVAIPQNILDSLEPIKHDDEAVRHFGTELATNIIKDVLYSGFTCGFHLFALNK